MFVFTPCGHRHDTLMPLSPYVIANHSASPTAACFVVVYGALPMLVSKPAADAVLSR